MESIVQTVLGSRHPDELGVTFTHEHLLHDIPIELFRKPLPSKLLHLKDAPVVMRNLGWIRQYPYSFDNNNVFTEEVVGEAVKEEMLFFKKCGGGTIVDNGSIGVRTRTQHKFLEKLSKESGVNIIIGTGFYVERAQLPHIRVMSEEDMAQKMRKEIVDGVDESTIKCGVIGEIGCSWPLLSTLFNEEDLLEFACLGTFCQFDLFGIEVSHYQHAGEVDMPSDAQRIALISCLLNEGYGEKIVLSHDIHTKHRIMKYGGHGYSHILVNVVPKMLNRGITREDINNFLINNPKKWLTFQ